MIVSTILIGLECHLFVWLTTFASFILRIMILSLFPQKAENNTVVLCKIRPIDS